MTITNLRKWLPPQKLDDLLDKACLAEGLRRKQELLTAEEFRRSGGIVHQPAVVSSEDPYADLRPPREQGRRRSKERLERIAAIYKRAYERGERPTLTVARIEGVSRPGVAKLVSAARKANLLSQTIQGKANV